MNVMPRDKRRVVVVVGARPNFVKAAPVLRGLAERGLDVDLVHTGQHYDPDMSDIFFEDLGIRQPDFYLNVGSGSHARQTAAVMVEFEELVHRINPTAVVVFGDVNSTLACALVGAKSGLLVFHVEAGLRSRDWSMPEEINRIVTDHVSDALFAPSADAVENLIAEGISPDRIFLVGNVMIDTLFRNLQHARQRKILKQTALDSGEYLLLTLHRPSNVNSAEHLLDLLKEIAASAAPRPVFFPVHPRTRVPLEYLELPKGIVLSTPLGYLDFLCLMENAAIVLTDSGGIQEETTALGVPCLTLRDSTERPITVTEGTNKIVGTDPEVVGVAIRTTLENPPNPRCPLLWDGEAGQRIASEIFRIVTDGSWSRPIARN